MKLDKLWIKDFKNLKDFAVNFDERSPVTVVIGWNGTGKSNLFEALVIIFRDLDLGKQTNFAYKLDYICHGNRVTIENQEIKSKGDDGSDQRKYKLKPPKIVPINLTLVGTDEKRNPPYLPAYVFGYYAGPSNRLKEHFSDHQRRYYDAVINADKSKNVKELKSLRRLFYAENHHSKYVLLAFFLKDDKKIKSFLEDYLRIVGLESVLFIMKKPYWAKSKNQHFWGARGLVRKFLDKLYKISLAPMHLKQRVATGIKSAAQEEFYYLYVKDVQALVDLAKDYETPSDFFAALESTDLSEIIHDVRVKIKVRNYDGTLTFRELSEGEQQLLVVLGLLRFTKEKESLILLDEPDTHLNPYWSTEYLDLLRQIVDDEKSDAEMPEEETRHIIMATHDPLVIAGLKKEQIQIFKRAEADGDCYAEIPERSPRGMGFEGVLTSDMFGFRSALDKPTLAKLDEKRRLSVKMELTPQEKQRLDELNEQIADLDFTNVIRDEHYRLFTHGMTKYELENNLVRRVLSAEEIAKREKFAQELVARILERDTTST